MIKPGKAVVYIGVQGEGEFSFLQPGGTLFVRSVDVENGTLVVQSPWDSCDRTTVRFDEVCAKRS